ncbi:MAG: hypothetical protein MMC23_005719 [Stictis urceolatum]|nr:hypothetical protein [Stictis urceolata]
MQATKRLFATITTASGASAARYLTPGNPTGLTGLLTHPSPRATLIQIYTRTLSALTQLPPSSAYRASTEALTKHRLSIVQSITPQNYTAWRARASKLIEEHPEQFVGITGSAPKELVPEWVEASICARDVVGMSGVEREEQEWDGEGFVEMQEGGGESEGNFRKGESGPVSSGGRVGWEPSPALEAAQVGELEERLGAGLVEEVIEVARGEERLVRVLGKERVWEELQDKAPQGQWEYFAREQHMPGTEEPGKKS